MTTELQKLQDALASLEHLNIVLRGKGKSAFLYIRSSNRSAEVSIDDDRFFVEYWDVADEESDKAPIRSESVFSQDDAIKNVTEWLTAGTS